MSVLPSAAVLAVARSELRRRWRSMVVLGLLAGLVGAVVTGAVALERRTSSAHDRLAKATRLDDARVLVFSDAVHPREVTSLPQVADSWETRQVIAQVTNAPTVTYLSVSSSPDAHPHIWTPPLIRGREPRPDRADEVMVPEEYVRQYGVGAGATLDLKLLTPLEVTQFDTGFGVPDGPVTRVRIVGVFRADRSWLGSGVGPVFGSAAFYRAFDANHVGHQLQLRLVDGTASVPAFRRAVTPLATRRPTDVLGREFGVLDAAFPAATNEPAVAAARRTLGSGLMVLIAVAVLGGLLAVVQGLGRHHGLAAAEQRIEAALGLTRSERVTARVLPALVGAAVAGVLSVAGGLVAAGVEPLGSLRQYEPDPGWHPDPAVIALTAVLVVTVFLAVAAITAARAVPRATVVTQGGSVARGLRLLGRDAPTAAGLSFALSGGRGRTSVPVRTTMVSAVIGVVGVVAVATFGSSLTRLGDEPARYGWTADFSIADVKASTEQQLRADRRVGDVLVVSDTTAQSGRTPFDVVSVRDVKGSLELPVLAGRLPTRTWEIALGSRSAQRLGVAVGDRLPVRSRHGSHDLRVVGLVINPDINDIGLGTSSVVTRATQQEIGPTTPFTTALVRAAPGVDAARLAARLGRSLEIQAAAPPPDVRNLVDLGSLPLLLAGFLGFVAAGVLAHGLVVTIRRRTGDLAVLRAIGFTPRQVATAMVTAAAAAAVVGLAVGVPLGFGLGRVVWHEIATGIGVAGDVAVPARLLALLVPATLAVACLVALAPAWQAARQRPADALRDE